MDRHYMQKIDEYDGIEELFCPECYRQLAVNVETFEITIITKGDPHAIHVYTRDISMHTEITTIWDELLDSMNFDEL